ncbi:hypothetical protein EV421DRAFT_168988 [Armillaria borealis]|uniref:F-box domain-containing protein n=1 Tax=Armillaria borealis TaxID=47425 RepID=A0AA39IX26_9AGAR|nr:hypothetical protein EV421DRAFT_168988 [Armillaria borealis]
MDLSSSLPLELLLKIFRHYLCDRDIPVQSFDFSDGLWVLGKVNRTWRSAILYDKSLWSKINVAVNYPPQDFIRPSPGFTLKEEEEPLNEVTTIALTPTTDLVLSYILLRSEDMPLAISLHFPAKRMNLGNAPSPVYRPFFSVLSGESPRWRTLDLVAPSPIWEDFANIPLSRLPLLQKVHGTLQHGHCLFQVIQRSSNVVDLAVELRYPDGNHALGNIYMPRLCKLLVGIPPLLDVIIAPNLKLLTVMNNYNPSSSPHVHPVSNFIRRSGCSLTNLELHWNGTANELFNLLSSIPTLESLSLFHSDFKVAFDKGMKLLPSVLPKLRALSIHRDVIVRNRERLVKPLDLFPDATPVIDTIQSIIAGGVLESVSVGLVVVDVFSNVA